MKTRLRLQFGNVAKVRITRACSGRHSAPPLIADDAIIDTGFDGGVRSKRVDRRL